MIIACKRNQLVQVAGSVSSLQGLLLPFFLHALPCLVVHSCVCCSWCFDIILLLLSFLLLFLLLFSSSLCFLSLLASSCCSSFGVLLVSSQVGYSGR